MFGVRISQSRAFLISLDSSKISAASQLIVKIDCQVGSSMTKFQALSALVFAVANCGKKTKYGDVGATLMKSEVVSSAFW
jgi:hypothetical protein